MPQNTSDLRAKYAAFRVRLLALLDEYDLPDDTPPTVNLTASNTTFTAPGAFDLIATAAGGTIARVEYYQDGTKIGEQFTPTNGVYKLPVEVKTAAQAGSYTAKAFTLAAASAPSTPAVVTVDIQTAPPVIPDTTPPTVILTANPNPVTAAGRISLTATATDNVGVTSVGLVRISPNPRAFPVLNGPPYVWEDPQDLTYLNSGTPITYSSTAYDAAFNASAPSLLTVPINIAAPPDTTPPTINSITTPGLSGSTVTTAGPQAIQTDATDAGSGMQRVAYLRGGVEVATSSVYPFSVNLNFTASDNGTVVITARAYDNAGNFKDQTKTLTVTISTLPALYTEPADAWTAYPWVDGTLDVTNAWLDANATQISSGLYAGWWKVTGLSRRNLITGQRAVRVNTTRKVLFSQCQFMGVRGGGTGVDTVGSDTWGTRVRFEDCSIYGPLLHMANGQSAGGLAFHYSRRFEVEYCNFISSKGINLTNILASGESGDGIRISKSRMKNIDGRIRDTAGAGGFSISNTINVGWARTQAVQINKFEGSQAAGSNTVYLGWLHISGEPGQQYIDDTINLNGLFMTANNPAIVENVLIDGAYSHLYNQNVEYSGGGVMFGDGNGAYQLGRKIVTIQTSNYGQAVAAGNYMTFEDGIVVGRGYLDNGTILNSFDSGDTILDPKDPDGGAYMRHYGMDLADVLPATRVFRRMKALWGRPILTDPARRWDYSVDTGRGTITEPVATHAGAVTKADEDEARNTFFGWATAAEVQFGRRAP